MTILEKMDYPSRVSVLFREDRRDEGDHIRLEFLGLGRAMVEGRALAPGAIVAGRGGLCFRGQGGGRGIPVHVDADLGPALLEDAVLLRLDDLDVELVLLEAQGLGGAVDRLLFGLAFEFVYHGLAPP